MRARVCSQVDAAQATIAGASVLVCQMEVPRDTTLRALRLAREAQVTTFFNPAPAVPDLEEEFFTVRRWLHHCTLRISMA